MLRKIFLTILLTVGLGDFYFRQGRAQIIWKPIETPKVRSTPLIWETRGSSSLEQRQTPTKWEVVPEAENQISLRQWWFGRCFSMKTMSSSPHHKQLQNRFFFHPQAWKKLRPLFSIIPLTPSDYQPLLRLSPLVSTAETLPVEQWRIAFGTISSFESEGGTSYQNYSVNLDIGFNDSLLLSLFVSQADDPLKAPLNGFTRQPGNFWQSYGAAARWQVLNQNNWKLAISGSLEVGTWGVVVTTHSPMQEMMPPLTFLMTPAAESSPAISSDP